MNPFPIIYIIRIRMGCNFFQNWYRIDLTTYFVCNVSKFCGFRGDPWLDDARQTTAHQIRAAEIKALKQISFPDMDSDGLPSSYTIKVVTCLGKWQMKMTDLSQQLDHTNPTMKPSPGCMLFLHAWHEFMLLGCRMLIALLFWFQLKLLNWSKRNHILHDRSIVFDFLSGWRQRLRPWFKTWASCLMRSARLNTTLIQDLGKLSDEICEVNSAGLAEGHTPEQLSLLHMNWNSQCVALKKWYISYINHDWCAHGAICSKILSI